MGAIEKTQQAPRIVPGDGGERLSVIGEDVTVKLSGDQTGGRFSLFAETSPPGGGPPPHIHANEDETFIVVEGEFEFMIGSERKRVKAGEIVFGPRMVPHTFKNVSAAPSRMYVLCAPSGFEGFFRKVDREIGHGAPDVPKLVAIGAEFGLTFVF
jgi:mannose-6-phosphate isomerase-like protein (cupin superfamily)